MKELKGKVYVMYHPRILITGRKSKTAGFIALVISYYLYFVSRRKNRNSDSPPSADSFASCEGCSQDDEMAGNNTETNDNGLDALTSEQSESADYYFILRATVFPPPGRAFYGTINQHLTQLHQ